MSRAPLLIAISLAVFPLFSAEATSRTRTPKVKTLSTSKATCEARAKFLRAIVKDQKVYWQFSLESATPRARGECPSVSDTLDVLVLSGQYVPALEKFVYPEYVTEPQPDSRNQLELERTAIRDPRTRVELRSWTIADWENGIRPLP